MTPNIKRIPDSDFSSLAELYGEMGTYFTYPISSAVSLYILTHDIAQYGNKFLAIGLYENKKLSGFVTGYPQDEETFYFSGLYMRNRSRYVIDLIDTGITYAENEGFAKWEADCQNDNMKGILLKKGAVVRYTRVRGGEVDG